MMTKAQRYLALVAKHQDRHGFIHSDECDSLLFTSLAACAGMRVDIWAAYDGESWHRRPVTKEPCCPNASKSSISRDMMLGLVYYAYASGDLKVIQTALKQMRRVVMGSYVGLEGLSRVLVSPGLYATAKIVERRILGKGPGIWNLIPAVGGMPQKGYRAHLQALHLSLRCLLTNKITEAQADLFRHLWMNDPLNPLMAVLGSDNTVYFGILYTNAFYPQSRLPTSRDRAPAWLPERNSLEYKPGTTEVVEHTGMDYNFCEWILTKWKKLKNTQL